MFFKCLVFLIFENYNMCFLILVVGVCVYYVFDVFIALFVRILASLH